MIAKCEYARAIYIYNYIYIFIEIQIARQVPGIDSFNQI